MPKKGKEEITPEVKSILDLYRGQYTSRLVDHMLKTLDERTAEGVKTYGTPLMTFNGRNALKDAREEAYDLLQYLVQDTAERIAIGELTLQNGLDDPVVKVQIPLIDIVATLEQEWQYRINK
jgi:hypothetical protein